MPMIDTGIVIEMAKESGDIVPVTGWRILKDCVAMPALIQPSAKIMTDYIGDEFIGEMLGKRTIAGLDFVFAFDGTTEDSQFKFLMDTDIDNVKRFLRVTYPEGTKFELFVDVEVTLIPPAPSGELDYTMAVTPSKSDNLEDLIQIVYADGLDPLVAVVDP